MSKMRVYELARIMGVESRELLDHLDALGIGVMTASNVLDGDRIALYLRDVASEEQGEIPHELRRFVDSCSGEATQEVRLSSTVVRRKTSISPSLNAKPDNIELVIERAKDGDQITLEAGEYKGPIVIDRPIILVGAGHETVIFAGNEPVVVVTVPGVRLESLAIDRMNGGAEGDVAVECGQGTAPVLRWVQLTGSAPGALIEGAEWSLPERLDLGKVQTNRIQEAELPLQVAQECRVASNSSLLLVTPTYLAPGSAILRLVVRGVEAPTGIKLNAAINLTDATGRLHTVPVLAEFISPETERYAKPFEVVDEPFDAGILGISFSPNAARKFVERLKGAAVFSDCRNEAVSLLLELTANEPCLYYLRKRGPGQDPNQERWDLTIATDRPDYPMPAPLVLHNKTLKLEGVVDEGGDRGFFVLNALLLDYPRGRKDGFALPMLVEFESQYPRRSGIPEDTLDVIAEWPACGDQVPTVDQIELWTSYLQIELAIAKARQFCVPYVKHNVGANARQITFRIAPDDATLNLADDTPLGAEKFWERALAARNDVIKLVDGANQRDEYRELGRIERIDANACTVRIRLEDEIIELIETGYLSVPSSGWLLFDAYGNIKEVERKGDALRELKEGKAQNPYLGAFFFDPSKARLPQNIVRLQDDQLLDPTRVNEEQRSAVEKVMASDDLVLIQGPPGTGKTTVIAEICFQVAREGKKTLIASQANLAVDNAMSRLSHHPIIRALRWGRADKVEDEGKPYLKERVLSTWLRDTATDCQRELDRRRSNVDLFQRLLADEKRFASYLRMEEKNEEAVRELRQTLQSLCAERAEVDRQISADEQELARVTGILAYIAGLKEQGGEAVWGDPALIALQFQFMPFIVRKQVVTNFQKDLSLASVAVKRLGGEVPELPILAQAAHLQRIAIQMVDDRKEQLLRCDEALSHVAYVRFLLQRIAEGEAKVHQEQQRLVTLLTNRDQKEGLLARLKAELDKINHLHRLVVPLSAMGDAIDWAKPTVIEMQEQLSVYLKDESSFGTFIADINHAVQLMSRLGVEIPALPPFSKAALCVQRLTEWNCRNSNAIGQLDALHALVDSAQHGLEEIDAVGRELSGERNLQQQKRDSLESLTNQENNFSHQVEILELAIDELGPWSKAVRAVAERMTGLVMNGAEITAETLPLLPPNLQQMVARIPDERLPWSADRDLFISRMKERAERVSLRVKAGELVQEVRQVLREARQVIGRERGRVGNTLHSGSLQLLPAKTLAALEDLKMEVQDFVARVRRPLSLLEKAGEWFGGCARRKNEETELERLENRTSELLALLPPAPQADELKEITDEFLVTLLPHGESWLERCRDSICKQLAATREQKASTIREMQRIGDRITELESTITALKASFRNTVERIEISLGDVEAMSIGVTQTSIRSREAFTELRLHLQQVTAELNRLRDDIKEINGCLEVLRPVQMLGVAADHINIRLGLLTDEHEKIKESLEALENQISSAKASSLEHENALNEDRTNWENCQFRHMTSIVPFCHMPRQGRLFRLLQAPLNTDGKAMMLEEEIHSLRANIATELEEAENAVSRLSALPTGQVLAAAHETVALQVRKVNESLDARRGRLEKALLPAIANAESDIRGMEEGIIQERSWWRSTWEAIPDRLRDAFPGENIHDPCFLRQLKMQFRTWRTELEKESAYLKRYESLVTDWIDRLRTPSERDAADLQSIYLANANVIGITCNQAAKPFFSREFPDFDVVIIDEVSKCTPPELLIPALKGKKVVLVGDHRQLPPMIKDKTLKDLAQECDLTSQDRTILKGSIFKSHYERADKSIKQDLRVQYRMHRDIMWAINQFYKGRLRCGIDDADTKRAHGLSGNILRDEQHIVWVSTPLNHEHREMREDNSTSYYNPGEIEAIAELCQQMNEAWAPKRSLGIPPKEVAIITFYLSQLKKIQERIPPNTFQNLNIRTGTVDRFQGMERPVVIVSLVRNNFDGDIGFAKEPERVNVAFSRAQELLVIVGCRELFVNARMDEPYYQNISAHVGRCGGLMDVSDVLG